jgi:hypothetical protein
VRHQRKIAALQLATFHSLNLKPAPTLRYEVEHQRVLHRRQDEPPRRTELGAAIKDAAHPQEMKRFAERIHGSPGILVFHAAKYI